MRKQSELINLFVVGSTAGAAAEAVGVPLNAAARIFMWLRKLVFSKLPGSKLSGEGEADASDVHHMRINHSELFADKGNHMNGFESLGKQAKRHPHRFNSIKKESFYCFLKEREWRFN